jgi:hypothetical protein
MIVTSRVISPQYLIWLLATAAFCVLSRDTSQRRSALLVLLALPLTQWLFPYNFGSLVKFAGGPILVLIVRDGLLLAAATIGFVDLWRDTVTGPFLPWRYRAALRAEQSAASRAEAVDVPAGDTPVIDTPTAGILAGDVDENSPVTSPTGA